MAEQSRLTLPVAGRGYDRLCPYCSKRWGANVHGERYLSLEKCAECQQKSLDIRVLDADPYRKTRVIKNKRNA